MKTAHKKSFWIKILPAIWITFTSCNYTNTESVKLKLEPRPNTSAALKLKGYYFHPFNDATNENVQVYFLYANGIILDVGSFAANGDYERHFTDDAFLEKVKSQRVAWGVYEIDSDSIRFEKWYHGGGSEKIAFTRTGVIEDKTTFRIVKMKRSEEDEAKTLSETYHFKMFHPKPDSTNDFIK
jgi:hypothetical protein